VLDSFYSQLRQCRSRCTRDHRGIDHRIAGPHDYDGTCGPLQAPWSVGQVHVLLNGAFARAVKWRWVGVDPMHQADAPGPAAT
jgi:hypothetical protein